MILLTLTPEYWGYEHEPPYLVYAVLGNQTQGFVDARQGLCPLSCMPHLPVFTDHGVLGALEEFLLKLKFQSHVP